MKSPRSPQSNPIFVFGGGVLLALNAGFINTLSLLGMYHQGVSHVTGTFSKLGIDLASGAGGSVRIGLLLLLFFLSGSLLCSLIVGSSRLKLGRRYGVVLMVQSLLLFGALGSFPGEHRLTEYLAAMACGLQNAMATTYSGAIIRTTHMTGILTDLGILLGKFFRQGQTEVWKLKLYLFLLGSFTFGSLLGSLAFQNMNLQALIFPACASGIVGLAYFLWRQRGEWLRRQRFLALKAKSRSSGFPGESPAPIRPKSESPQFAKADKPAAKPPKLPR